MKKIVFIAFVLLLSEVTFSQITFTSNENPVGMEHNMLFNATTRSRFQVTQTGSAALSLDYLFDGKFIPSYTSTPPTLAEPTVVLIKGLVNWHSQQGAWVGWSTRYWGAKRFKIEGYNVHVQSEWRTIADYSTQDYTGGGQFLVKVPSGSYTELRFTFYEGTGPDGNLGVSELFYLHPEAVRPYEGLLGEANNVWSKNTNSVYTSDKVGIGTGNPEANLQIGSSTTNGLIMLGGGKGYSSIGSTRSDGGLILGKNVYTRYQDGTDNSVGRVGVTSGNGFSGVKIGHNGLIDFFGKSGNVVADEVANTNQTSRVRITEDGKVGIGTTTPAEKLEVIGGVKATVFTVKGSSFTSRLTSNILQFSRDGFSYIDNIKENGSIAIRTGGTGNVDLLVKPDGKVGIGTIETGKHRLAVEGSIGAREIKVEATGWSDFVFENEYKLPTLKEVEDYIKEKGHLKDIPSEAEVLKNGFYLGEMDSKLLQKIEELTLYTIQQEKQLKEQAKNIKRLETLVEKLLESKKQNTAK
ncbi:hypothetical protein [Tenacibaculum aiptasiae]|uniref:hypothetical protein n=1 Tax=Tenacibaculum aiptasiae TaxID=426481 RepID=UPI003B5C2B63